MKKPHTEEMWTILVDGKFWQLGKDRGYLRWLARSWKDKGKVVRVKVTECKTVAAKRRAKR